MAATASDASGGAATAPDSRLVRIARATGLDRVLSIERSGPLDRRRVLLVAALLALVGVVSLLPLRGLWLLHTGHGVDFQERWQEMHYFLRGIDPNVYGLTSSQSATSDELFVVFDDLVTPRRPFPVGVYPPWTYALTAPLHFPSSLPAATGWFVAINALALATLVAWAARRGWRAGRKTPAVAMAAAAAIGAVAMLGQSGLIRTLVIGNYGVLVLLLLVGSLVALERGRPTLAGLLFGLALLKPTLSGPFVIALAVIAWRRRPREALGAVAGATGVVVAASLVAWQVTGVDPLTSTLAAQSHLASYASDGGGSAQLWERELPEVQRIVEHGRPVRLDQYVLMLLALTVGGVLALVARRGTPLEQFGLASVVALTWSYHRPYDSLLLVFLLLALLERAFRLADAARREGRRTAFVRPVGAALVALVVGVTLWTPTQFIGWPESTLLLQGLWLGAAILLALSIRADGRRHRRRPPMTLH